MTQAEEYSDPTYQPFFCQALLASLDVGSGFSLTTLEIGVTFAAQSEPSASKLAAAWSEHHYLAGFAVAVRSALLLG